MSQHLMEECVLTTMPTWHGIICLSPLFEIYSIKSKYLLTEEIGPCPRLVVVSTDAVDLAIINKRETVKRHRNSRR